MRASLGEMLRVPADGDLLPLPGWARFFVELGTALGARTDDDNRRVVMATATPTRAYAAVLCAVGIVGVRVETPVATDAISHFEYLMTLPHRTTVTHQQGLKKKHKGWLDRCVTENGQRLICIRCQAQEHGGLTIKVSARDSLSVRVADDELRALPREVISQVVRVQPGLMEAILAQSTLSAFLQNSRLECVIVGNESLLHEEILRTPFSVSAPSGAPISGKLQDILRVRRLTGGKQSYRSELYSATGTEGRSPSDETPPVVIFDGSLAFLRWTAAWPKAHWVAVLDRSDARFDDAAGEINRLYVGERANGGASPLRQQVPPSLECMVFEVPR